MRKTLYGSNPNRKGKTLFGKWGGLCGFDVPFTVNG
jgi:hypothetical protein